MATPRASTRRWASPTGAPALLQPPQSSAAAASLGALQGCSHMARAWNAAHCAPPCPLWLRSQPMQPLDSLCAFPLPPLAAGWSTLCRARSTTRPPRSEECGPRPPPRALCRPAGRGCVARCRAARHAAGLRFALGCHRRHVLAAARSPGRSVARRPSRSSPPPPKSTAIRCLAPPPQVRPGGLFPRVPHLPRARVLLQLHRLPGTPGKHPCLERSLPPKTVLVPCRHGCLPLAAPLARCGRLGPACAAMT